MDPEDITHMNANHNQEFDDVTISMFVMESIFQDGLKLLCATNLYMKILMEDLARIVT